MFTGIIETVRKVLDISKNKIVIENKFYKDLEKGESISVDGVCLTLVEWNINRMVFDVSPQTYQVTAIRFLKVFDTVNIERAIKANSRFGGHFVTGHVDEVGYVIDIKRYENFYKFSFKVSSTKYLIEKGSISVSGISLTVFDIKDKSFSVAVIPHTFLNTKLYYLKKNSPVNIEFDIISKYLLKSKKSNITLEYLKENGFI